MIPADSNSWYFSFANSIDPTYWDIVSLRNLLHSE